VFAQDGNPQAIDAETAQICGTDDDAGSDTGGTEQKRSHGGKRCTPQQKAFARAYVANRGNGTDAAIEAGYKNPAVAASRLLLRSNVTDEVRRLSVVDIEAQLPALIARASAIALDDETPPKVALSAIFGLLDRGGMKPQASPLFQINNTNNTNNDNRTVIVSPQEVLRELEQRRAARLSGISASMSDETPALEHDAATPLGDALDPGRGGVLDVGTPALPVPLPTFVPATSQNPSEKL
jgi:hypothetical protein